MKKVLQIIEHMGAGGAQKIITDTLILMKNDKKIKFSLLVLTSKSDSSYEQLLDKENIPIIYLHSTEGYNGNNIIRKILNKVKNRIIDQYLIYKKLMEISPDIIHSHITPIQIKLFIPFLVSRIPIWIHTMHSDPLRFSCFIRCFTKILCRYINFFPVAVTKGQLNRINKYYNINNCYLLRNRINVFLIKKYIKALDKKHARRLFNIPENAFVVGGAGRFVQIKKFDKLVEIFFEYQKYNNNSFLILVGDGPERRKISDLISQYKLEKKSIIIGSLPTDKMIMFYSSIDVFLQPSISESCSLVALEAQAVGIPVIVSDAIPTDILFSNKTVQMKKDASIREWAAEIYKPSYLQPQASIDNYDINTLKNDIYNIYHSILLRVKNGN
ncbi:MAG: glycosyltransferase family 1 protein [Selenomonas ruminantium]|jgi:glycosyltransferase involved in cell wall biosynthesis|nr:glycosyltransferase family 1 protein [Selenomonas ruminantium]